MNNEIINNQQIGPQDSISKFMRKLDVVGTVSEDIQDNEQLLSAEDVAIIGNGNYGFSNDEPSLLQKAFLKASMMSNEPLKDGVLYLATLKDISSGVTFKSNIPTLNFDYEVDNGTSEPKFVTDTYFLNENNFNQLTMTMMKLNKTVMKYDFRLTTYESNDIKYIVDACKNLIGLKAIIRQTTRENKYYNYEIITTEKKYNFQSYMEEINQ